MAENSLNQSAVENQQLVQLEEQKDSDDPFDYVFKEEDKKLLQQDSP